MMDKHDKPDMIDPMLATESTEATDPAEPMDRTEPAEPMERIEPVEPIDRIDPLDPMLSSEPADPAGFADLARPPDLASGRPRIFAMSAFSQRGGKPARAAVVLTTGAWRRWSGRLAGCDDLD